MVDERPIGLVSDGGHQWNLALDGRPHHNLFVEAPKILDRAAAAGDDQHVRPRHGAADTHRVEAANGGGHLGGAGFALDAYRPDEDVTGETVLKPMKDVADDRAGRRSHHSDDPG